MRTHRLLRKSVIPIALVMALSGSGPITPETVRANTWQPKFPDLDVIVIPVHYPDVEVDAEAEVEQLRQGLVSYLDDMSNKRMSTMIDKVGWVTLPRRSHQYASYGASGGCAQEIIRDALYLADPDVDFRLYDSVIVMTAIVGEDYCVPRAYAPELTAAGFPTNDKVVDRLALTSQRSYGPGLPLWVLAHEFTHTLGMPDLYNQVAGFPLHVGAWDPMSSWSSYGFSGILGPVWSGGTQAWKGHLLQGYSAYTRTLLNLSTPQEAVIHPRDQDSTYRLCPSTSLSDGVRSVSIPVSPAGEYIVENRQQMKWDTTLPRSGILLMLVDRSRPITRSPYGHFLLPVQVIDANPETPSLHDATFDLRRPVFVDPVNGVRIQVIGKQDHTFAIRISGIAVVPTIESPTFSPCSLVEDPSS